MCSSKNVVFLYKVSFQSTEKSVRRTFSFQPCLTLGGKGEANETQRDRIPILYSVQKLG